MHRDLVRVCKLGAFVVLYGFIYTELAEYLIVKASPEYK